MGCLAVRGELLSFSLFPSSIFRWRGDFTSLLPRPNPLITGPERRMGNGVSGPESGPETGGRGVEDGISFFLSSFFFFFAGLLRVSCGGKRGVDDYFEVVRIDKKMR